MYGYGYIGNKLVAMLFSPATVYDLIGTGYVLSNFVLEWCLREKPRSIDPSLPSLGCDHWSSLRLVLVEYGYKEEGFCKHWEMWLQKFSKGFTY